MSKDDKTKSLEFQVLQLGKEVDELRRQYVRFQQQLPNSEFGKYLQNETSKTNAMMFEFGETLNTLDALFLEKGIYSTQDFRRVAAMQFLTRQKFDIINGLEKLENEDLAFIKFQCKDEDGKVLFEETDFTKYQMGIGILPFEDKIAVCKVGSPMDFDVSFPETFFNKSVAGKTVKVHLESMIWARKPKAISDSPNNVVSLNKNLDKPLELDAFGGLKK